MPLLTQSIADPFKCNSMQKVLPEPVLEVCYSMRAGELTILSTNEPGITALSTAPALHPGANAATRPYSDEDNSLRDSGSSHSLTHFDSNMSSGFHCTPSPPPNLPLVQDFGDMSMNFEPGDINFDNMEWDGYSGL